VTLRLTNRQLLCKRLANGVKQLTVTTRAASKTFWTPTEPIVRLLPEGGTTCQILRKGAYAVCRCRADNGSSLTCGSQFATAGPVAGLRRPCELGRPSACGRASSSISRRYDLRTRPRSVFFHWVWVYAIAVWVQRMQFYNASPSLPFSFPRWTALGGWLGGGSTRTGIRRHFGCRIDGLPIHYGFISGHSTRFSIRLRARWSGISGPAMTVSTLGHRDSVTTRGSALVYSA